MTWKPWGEVQAVTGTATLNLRFPGQYFQIETGLAYNWHRHYDPVTGRYTQPDPLGFVDGPSIYQYAMARPFTRTDSTGLDVVIRGRKFPPIFIPGPSDHYGRKRNPPCPGCIELPTQPWDPVGDFVHLCKRVFGFSGGGDDDEDNCDVQRDRELAFCGTRFIESALPGAKQACIDRANIRWVICKRNGRTGGNESMPDPWSEADEEVWRNLNR